MTAVEKLEISLLGLISFDSEELRTKYKERIANAKEIEKEQKDDFAIKFSEWCLISLLNGEEPKAETTKELLEIFKNK